MLLLFLLKYITGDLHSCKGGGEVPCLVRVEMHPIFKIIQLYWIDMKNWSKLFTVNLETHKSLFLFLVMRYLCYRSLQE